MSDQNAQPENAPSFNMQRVYLKDLSLEMPNAPNIFLEQDAHLDETDCAHSSRSDVILFGVFRRTLCCRHHHWFCLRMDCLRIIDAVGTPPRVYS